MHHSANPDHARHDRTLIAGHAARDLSDIDAAAAAALLASCGSCAELHRDLVAIAAATRALPRTARAPRDFQITEDQAHHLHRGSWVRTLLRPFASTRSATRPLAAAFTSFGIAGLLVATFVPGLLGSAASAPGRDAAAGGAGAATAAPAGNPEIVPNAAQATGDTFGPGAAGAASADPDAVKDAEDSGMYVAIAASSSPDSNEGRSLANAARTAGTTDQSTGVDVQGTASRPTNALLLGSVGLLLLGLAMFGLRFAARRLR